MKEKPVVLVVESNNDSMITVKALLADNYTVIEATNGDECIEMAKKHRVNIILMNTALPGTTGLEVFKTIRRLPKLGKIPVIALTTSVLTTDREDILAYGFDDCILKPIDEYVFFKSLNETLNGK